MSDSSKEFAFQYDLINQLAANDWLLDKPKNYNRKLSLYQDAVLAFV